MITRPSKKKVALIVPALLILMQFGLAHHFHCANSYHNDRDCFHAPCVYSIDNNANRVIAEVHGSFTYSPLIREDVLVAVDSKNDPPVIVIDFTPCRAPPALFRNVVDS